jgi:hypothetical protein
MEDMYFIQRMHELGVTMHVDCDETMSHIANIAITPVKWDGRWYPGYLTPSGQKVIWDDPELAGVWGKNIISSNIKVI